MTQALYNLLNNKVTERTPFKGDKFRIKSLEPPKEPLVRFEDRIESGDYFKPTKPSNLLNLVDTTKEKIIKFLKRETEIQKKISEFLEPEETIKVKGKYGEYEMGKYGEIRLGGEGPFIDVMGATALRRVGMKIGESAIKKLVKIADPDEVIKLVKKSAGEVISRKSAELVAKAKTPALIRQILDVEIQSRPLTAVQKLINALREAKPVREAQEKLYTQERKIRAARIEAIGKKVKGERGFFTQLSQLKGELSKKTFESVKKLFTQKEIDSLFDAIQQTSTLLPLEKVATKKALWKITEGVLPTRSEIRLLNQVFPEEFIDEILKKGPVRDQIKVAILKAFNLPRAVIATADLSAPLRQGIFLIGRPKQFFPAFRNMFKFFAKEEAYRGLMEEIARRPTYELMKKRIAFSEISGDVFAREEIFRSNWAEKIPGFGKLAKASNRAFSGFLNKLRADVFDDIIRRNEAIGRKLTEKDLDGIARFINSATGRGDLPKFLQGSAEVLSSTFFAPRLMASRINLLNPVFYINLSSVARKEALKSLFSFAGIAGSVLTLSELAGAEVVRDIRNADFGKIKIDNVRYDILGGFQQYLVLAGRIWTGEMVSSTTGRTFVLGEGFGLPTIKDILIRFFESKENPVVSFIMGILEDENFVGEDFDLPAEVINRFIPLVFQDLFDLVNEVGERGIFMSLPAFFGTGVQVYGRQELVFGESKLGQPTAQIRPVRRLENVIRENILGRIPLGPSRQFSLEAYWDQLNNLSVNEAAKIFDEIKKTNPELAKKLAQIGKERRRGITAKDKDLRAKSVASGDRALAVKKELDKLKTKEEKAKLWDEYVKKGIITRKVSEQLNYLLTLE